VIRSYPRKTTAEQMQKLRQARRVECNGALACACGSHCPSCAGQTHTLLGRHADGRVFRCVDCGHRYIGTDMFVVVNRAGDGEHLVGVTFGQTRCSCEAGSRGGNCWAQDRVRDYLRREAARMPSPASTTTDTVTADDVFAMLDSGDHRRPALRVVQS
jgi:Zn ribbon nucleic-acid-binding protein